MERAVQSGEALRSRIATSMFGSMNTDAIGQAWPSGTGEMAKRLRHHDWTATSLGPPQSWPQALRSLVAIMTNSSQPMFVVWGPERTLLYNDGYGEILASKHPGALGQDFLEVWREIRDDLAPIVGKAYDGRPVFMHDIALSMRRRGFVEEAHFTFSYTPVNDDSGAVAGFFCPCTEITRQVLAERAVRRSEERQAFLLKLSDALRPVEDALEVQTVAARLLGAHLDASRVAYAEDAGDGNYLILKQNYVDGAAELEGPYRYSNFGENLVRELREGRTVVRSDVANDPLLSEEEKAAHAALQLGATLNVPSVKGANLVAVLFVHHRKPHVFADEEIALVQEVAERTWVAVERARAEARLRESERRYNLIVTGARDYAIFTIDQVGTITSWPPGAAAVFGWTEDEMMGESFARIFTDEDRATGAPARELATAERDGVAPDVRWHVKKDGKPVFIEGTVLPVGRKQAGPQGFIKIGQDVTARHRAAEKLAESEARLSAIFSSASVGLSELSPTGRLFRVNDELCRILGRSREELLNLSVAEVTHHEDLQKTLEAVGRVLKGEAGGAGSAIDKRYIRPDGSIVWANSRATVLPGHRDEPGNLLAVTVDLTERKAAERAVQESEARFREFGDASSDVLWIRNAETLESEYLSAAFESIYGVDRVAALQTRHTMLLSDLVVPEDWHPTVDAIRRLRDGSGEYEYRIRRASDGELRWLRTTGFPLVDSDGVVRRIGGITHDMTEEKRTADRMEVLVSELQHRTRNLIGVVRAMASRTLKSSRTIKAFRTKFGERLEALARANGLLSRLEEGERVTFDELLATELRGQGVIDDEGRTAQVKFSGPKGVDLPSAAVQTLALALHELLTNASKHGALKRPTGRLVIEWSVIEGSEPRLRVDWLETGISGREQSSEGAAAGGYGRELIERALPYQLGAETKYDLGSETLRCVILLPIARRQ